MGYTVETTFKTRTVHELVTAVDRMQEAEGQILSILSDAKLSPVEVIGLLEGIKAGVMRNFR